MTGARVRFEVGHDGTAGRLMKEVSVTGVLDGAMGEEPPLTWVLTAVSTATSRPSVSCTNP